MTDTTLRRLYYHNNNDGTTNSRPQPSPLSWPTIRRRQPLRKRHVHRCYWVDSEALFFNSTLQLRWCCPVDTTQTIIPLDTTQVVSAPLRLLFCASAPLAMSKIEDSHCSWVNSEAIFLPTRSRYSAPADDDDSSSTSIVNNLLLQQTPLQRMTPSDNAASTAAASLFDKQSHNLAYRQ